MQVKVKKMNPNAKLPEYKTRAASGFDLEACIPYALFLSPGGYATIPTGLAFEICEGYEVQVRPRSGHGSQGILAMLGTIDADYRGEVKVTVYNHTSRMFVVESGMRLAQGVLAKALRAEILEASSLGETPRGSEGHGSTGR